MFLTVLAVGSSFVFIVEGTTAESLFSFVDFNSNRFHIGAGWSSTLVVNSTSFLNSDIPNISLEISVTDFPNSGSVNVELTLAFSSEESDVVAGAVTINFMAVAFLTDVFFVFSAVIEIVVLVLIEATASLLLDFMCFSELAVAVFSSFVFSSDVVDTD